MGAYLNAAAAYLFAKLAILLVIPWEILKSPGDLTHFFNLAALPGWPYLNYWVEYPPIFPFLSKFIFNLAAGNESSYTILLLLVLALADLASIGLFFCILNQIRPLKSAVMPTMCYGLVLAVFPYSIWYFDPICVCCLLWGIFLLVEDKPVRFGLVGGLGILIKFFPLLLAVPAWGKFPGKKFILFLVVTLGTAAGVFGLLELVSPNFTNASLMSQSAKGSWESIWALIDGNPRTGLFGPLTERFDPAMAIVPRGNPALIPSWLTLVMIGGFGGWVMLRFKSQDPRKLVAALLFTFCLLLIWSPGYSPQWVLYVIPLILLVFPLRRSGFFILILAFIHLLEWPMLLSAGQFWSLFLTVPLRVLIYLVIALFSYAELQPLKRGLRHIDQPADP